MNAEVVSTSSIGAIWPPIEASHERLKGFYPDLVTNLETTGDFIAAFDKYQQETQSHPVIDRLTIRYVGSTASVAMVNEAGITVEGTLPIAQRPDLHVVYCAWNGPERQIDEAAKDKHRLLLNHVITREISQSDPEKEIVDKGFESHIISAETDPDFRKSLVPNFLGLYGTFGFTEADVEELVSNRDNTIAFVTTAANEIISTSLAERASVHVEGLGLLHIVEISEANTARQYEGNGLYRALSRHLVNFILETGQIVDGAQADILYGESNLSSPGVLYAAQRNGRLFSAHQSAKFAITNPTFGILRQNFKVDDGHETRAYNDFALSYVPLD